MISWRTSSVPKENVVVPRLLYSDSRRSQTCRRSSHVLPGLSTALPGLLPGLPGAPKHLSGAPTCSHTYCSHSHGTPVPVLRDPRYSEGRQECPARVWYSPEIDASKFTLHILSDTPGVFQRLEYIVLMYTHCEVVGSLRVNSLSHSLYYGTSHMQCLCIFRCVRNLLVMVLRLNESLKLAELIPTWDCSGPAPTFVPVYSEYSTPRVSSTMPVKTTFHYPEFPCGKKLTSDSWQLEFIKLYHPEHVQVERQKNLTICSAPRRIPPAQHCELNANKASLDH